MKKVLSQFSKLNSRLFKYSEEAQLNVPSRIIVLILDFVLLILLFSGLADHSRQLTSPNDYLPYEFREAIIQNDWLETNKLSKLENLVVRNYTSYSYAYDRAQAFSKLKKKHPLVQEFFDSIKQMSEDDELRDQFIKRGNLQRRKSSLQQELNVSLSHYQTGLLEDIAKREVDVPDASNEQTNRIRNQLDQTVTEYSRTEDQILKNPLVIHFFKLIESHDFDERRSKLIKEFKTLERWHPLKEFCWQLLFLLPLIIIVYLWNSRSLRNESNIQILLSSHLLLISSIPVVFRLIDFIIELIPNHLFTELFLFLKGLKIIAIWHYLVIALSVFAAAALIVLFQKKLLSQSKIAHRRTLNGNCYSCGRSLPPNSKTCPTCGKSQYTTCKACGEEKLIGTIRCNQCGNLEDINKN